MALTMLDKAAEKKDKSQWPADIAAEFAREAKNPNPCVGNTLLSETDRTRVWIIRLAPGERIGFHRHVLDYFWTCVSGGRARQYVHDGAVVEFTYQPGETRHAVVPASARLPGPAEAFQLETGRPLLYLNSPSTSEVLVIDTDKNEIAKRYPIKAAKENQTMALDEANHRIFIGCRKPGMTVVLDSETGKEIATVAIPGETDDLFFDAKRKRLYASCGEGFLAVIRQVDADHYELQDKIATVKDARTSYFDGETGRLYLGVPRQMGKKGPEIRVYQAP